MKTSENNLIKLLFNSKCIWKVLLVISFVSCNKDDAVEPLLPEQKVIDDFEETENNPPTSPVLNFPTSNEELVPLTPEFNWETSTDPEDDGITYNLFLSPIGRTLELVANDLTSTTHITEIPLDKNTSYQWKVDAIDDKGNTTASEIFNFKTELNSITQLTHNAPFSKRKNAALKAFNGKIWLIGGEDESGNVLSEIWSSEDGVNWNLETNDAAFGPRRSHAVVVFQNKMWIYNGSNGTHLNNEIWSSEDGINWVQETNDLPWNNTPFFGQSATTIFVYDNKIWRLAAYDGSIGDLTTERNVWNSEDGKNWTLVNENHGFDRKYGMKVVSFQGKLVAFESYNLEGANISKVRQSTNGMDWEIITDSLPFDIGLYPDAVVYHGKLFVTGGLGYNELWFSNDGITWSKAAQQLTYPTKSGNTSVVFNDKIYIVGGNLNETSNDIWVIE